MRANNSSRNLERRVLGAAHVRESKPARSPPPLLHYPQPARQRDLIPPPCPPSPHPTPWALPPRSPVHGPSASTCVSTCANPTTSRNSTVACPAEPARRHMVTISRWEIPNRTIDPQGTVWISSMMHGKQPSFRRLDVEYPDRILDCNWSAQRSTRRRRPGRTAPSRPRL